MSSVAERLAEVRRELPEGVELVAVSKFHPVEALREAYEAGQRVFGESRVQELLAKEPQMPGDVRWHFIGHLQTNKVKQLVGHVSVIESIDSERLLEMVDARSEQLGVVTHVLMQVHVAREETKTGFLPEELEAYFAERRFERLRAVHIDGVMGMASNTDDLGRVRADFAAIVGIYRRIRHDIAPDLRGFDRLSMGMSGDWRIAVEEGSNVVRIGSFIFGQRDYTLHT